MLCLLPFVSLMLAADPWLVIPGGSGPGKGKTVVLISGDEEYRSEEALPQLAKILSTRHGFDTVTLFAIDPATGEINPNKGNNIPGLEALAKADLVIMGLRFRARRGGRSPSVPDRRRRPHATRAGQAHG